MINGEMIAKESQELHSSVVAPTLRLLSGRPGWGGVEAGYQKALREISDGHPDDAITDVGTAIQDTLRLLGCSGGSLTQLRDDAVRNRILMPYDQKIVDWIGADRSQLGDGHTASGATAEDAWLAVHIGGALILRLASAGPRQAPS